mmetsp:Transcript_4464/g.9702  ORF Transcript_4464/g.9702 Transcript_4464/m.9702 type:complete len:428 (+) Transcript_4464:307-1590(+)|eukprot:CAMPEP_0168193530 /NCGR_PEP_ID=MMETSP0139_2-20121125/18659_1 /TAXON_ID=44445 /ORGANISM="Pseudo-nitzschia australis, Strain 10249 10 AB" /LENGTH=427 /DNA_ID=CAMNT_0008116899 /DNA_START=221 /DNA_END=1504 /DNA_ORIENTATION=-
MIQIPVSLSLPLLLLLLPLDYKTDLVIATTSPQPSHTHPVPSLHRKLTTPSTDCASVSYHSLFWVARILGDLRGGGREDYEEYEDEDESYDEYDYEEEDLEEPPIPGRDRNRKAGYDHSMIDPSRPRPRPGYNPNSPPRGRKGKKNSSSFSSATDAASAATKLATKSLSMTGSLAWNALVKQPGKLAFHVIRPKHVDLVETFGLWRLDQQVVEKSNKGGGDQRTIASVATIELARPPPPLRRTRGRSHRGSGPPPPPMVIVRRSKSGKEDHSDQDTEDNDIVYRAPYTFVRKNKYLKGASLSSFQTSFVAPAFLVGENQTRLYGYKGAWQRKLADKSVIKLKGKIYQVHKQKFGKKQGEYVYGPAVGTFVMRRRISMSKEEEEEEEDYDEDSDFDEFEYDNDYEEEYSEVEHDEFDYTSSKTARSGR